MHRVMGFARQVGQAVRRLMAGFKRRKVSHINYESDPVSMVHGSASRRAVKRRALGKGKNRSPRSNPSHALYKMMKRAGFHGVIL